MGCVCPPVMTEPTRLPEEGETVVVRPNDGRTLFGPVTDVAPSTHRPPMDSPALQRPDKITFTDGDDEYVLHRYTGKPAYTELRRRVGPDAHKVASDVSVTIPEPLSATGGSEESGNGGLISRLRNAI